ncbi:MAG: 4'-phosphopantetheinyl transferase superfamily protein [Muribaculaceae bacterium]|nr:4'-phosphopantetheinyl transferase superfamily protein [Roseburia sp.]MCM1430892.1 4'-phosphopantetheinyl transferase superfamily protein [Muribaculaceae bacterium]MCM1491747.1 4'-phosphopantetheinyl transferase superfamily protein [Muribaculaceae bacterium]
MTDIYFYQLPDSAGWADYAPLLPCISTERQTRIACMPSDKNKILSLCAELLLRRIACRQLAVENDSLHFQQSEHGKPFLCGHEGFHFNWSHAKDALALAVADSPVGIDLEQCPPRGDVEKLARRFYTKKEASYVLQADEGRETRFCEIWTRKEAWTKCTGSGLTVALDSFDVTSDPRLTTFRHGDYMISLCCDSPGFRLTILTDIR